MAQLRDDIRTGLVYGMSDSLVQTCLDAISEKPVSCRSFTFGGVDYSTSSQKAAMTEALGKEGFKMLASVPNSVSADVLFTQVASYLKQKNPELRCRKLSEVYLQSLSYREIDSVLASADVLMVGMVGCEPETSKRLIRLLSEPTKSFVVCARARYTDHYSRSETLGNHSPAEYDRDYLQFGSFDSLVYLDGLTRYVGFSQGRERKSSRKSEPKKGSESDRA